MEVLRRSGVPKYTRKEGIVSYLLASPRTSGAEHLTTTLVEIQPGGEQRMHSHIPEQVYYILEGEGVMAIADESQRVGPGDCVFIPSRREHGIKNQGTRVLKYFSAAAPAFRLEDLKAFWPVRGDNETGAD